MVRRSSAALALFLAALAPAAAGAEPPLADRAAWEQVDIVPMPKRIRLTGRRLPMANAVIVLGTTPSEQDRIGAKWINDHVVAKGGKPLAVVSGDKLPANASLRLFVGTRDTCKAIDAAARAGLVRLGPTVPGKHGYVVQHRRKGATTDLVLGGADPVGALYACVTLAGLLDTKDGMLVVREAEIIDWPDFHTVSEGWGLYRPELENLGSRCRWAGDKCSPALKAAYLHAIKQHLDRLLAWKISCFKAGQLYYWRNLSPAFMATYREVTDYAKARGIRSLLYALQPFVGLKSDLPDAPKRCLTGTGRSQYQRFVRCWSMDADRRRTAARIGEFARATGLTDIGFHDTDTGGFLNPARWNDRCEVCRKRWGDDFAAATIHKHRIYYDEITKRAPGCRLHFTLYPYNISVLTQAGAERYHVARYGPSPSVPAAARRVREKFTDFWRQMTKGLPADVSFCIRETVSENARRFHALTAPHGTFIWYKVGSEQWQAFFDESPRWAPTFYSGRDDVMFTVSLESFVPLKALAVREYTWNVGAPGATGWAMLPLAERERHAEAKGDIYQVVLPHLVRNLFGRRAAPELTQALSLNMAMNHIFDHLPSRKRRAPVLTTHEKWQWQADQAAKGCELLDALFTRFATAARGAASPDRLGMTPYAARRFVYIREVFHCCKWMAAAKAANAHARELAKASKLDLARAAIARGRQAIAHARADMTRLVAERPPDPIYNAPLDYKKRPPRWKVYTPGNQVDYAVPEKLLDQTEKELPALAAAGDLPESARRLLAKRTGIHLAPAPHAPTIDGRPDEPAWRHAVPAESLFVYPDAHNIARAHTRARFLRHDKTLYVAFTCWMPGGAPIRAASHARDESLAADELVELFLMPPHLRGGYCHFQINAAGSLSDKRVTFAPAALGGHTRRNEPEWNTDGMQAKTSRRNGIWEAELAIPLAALGANDWRGTWRANICRDFKGPGAARELSSIQQPTPRDFHDTSRFLTLVSDPTPAPPPDVELAVAGVKPQTRTLDDRIATVVEFGLEAHSSRVLHNVRITAETYDTTGRLHLRRVVKRLDHLVYYWRPRERFAIAFEQQVKAGAVRLLLESDEASAECWVRLGWWQGTAQCAPLLSAPAGDAGLGSGLVGQCILPSEAEPQGKHEPALLIGRRRGTIEFWLKPSWPPRHPLEARAPWTPRHALVHCGVLRRDHPELANHSALVLWHDAANGALHFAIRNRKYAGWTVSARVGKGTLWRRPGWYHVACVWDHDAKPNDWLRLYVDGTRVGGKTTLSKPERLGDDKAVELAPTAFATQLGSLNSGRWPARAAFADLRISRTARYRANFSPPPRPLTLAPHTTALLHFDGTLDGEGMTEAGRHYPVRAVPGVLEHH